MLTAQIFLTLLLSPSIPIILSLLTGQLTLTCPCVGVHWRTLLMSFPLLLQQCFACFVCVSSRICSKQHIAFLCSSMHFVGIHVVHLYRITDTATPWKKSCFILSDRSDFHMIDDLLIVVHAFTRHMLTSIDQILLSRYVNLSNFSGQPFRMKMAPPCLKHVLYFVFMWRPIPPTTCLYAVGIWLWLVYLQEILNHLHSLCLL